MLETNPVRIASLANGGQPEQSAALADNNGLFKQAQDFESVFIAEMLKYSGFAEALSSNGGFGGEAFSSMLIEQYADKIAEKGGFGLAEHIYEQLDNAEARRATDWSA